MRSSRNFPYKHKQVNSLPYNVTEIRSFRAYCSATWHSNLIYLGGSSFGEYSLPHSLDRQHGNPAMVQMSHDLLTSSLLIDLYIISNVLIRPCLRHIQTTAGPGST